MKLSDTGLRMQPFQTHGKPVVVVPCESQNAAIQFLHEIRSDRHGLGLFLGPPLSGKTSVICQFTESLGEDCAVAIVDGADKDANALLQAVLGQFGFDHGFDTLNERLAMTRVFAMQQAASSEAPLLVIENVNAMGPLALEALRDLAELRVKGRSALRIILSSRKPMCRILEAPAMEPLSERVTGRFLLQPLKREETGDYVYRKLKHGGCMNPHYLVPPDICDQLHRASGGWPGMIDQLAITAIANAEKFPLRAEHLAIASGPESRAEESSVAIPQLILTHRHQTLDRISLSDSRLIIGRSALCDLRIEDDWISRHHAVLFRNGSTTIVIDMKSRNGIYVNDRRVSEHILAHDDIIALGDHRLKFVDPSVRRQTTLQSAGQDETTISKSIKGFRNLIAKQLRPRSAM